MARTISGTHLRSAFGPFSQATVSTRLSRAPRPIAYSSQSTPHGTYWQVRRRNSRATPSCSICERNTFASARCAAQRIRAR